MAVTKTRTQPQNTTQRKQGGPSLTIMQKCEAENEKYYQAEEKLNKHIYKLQLYDDFEILKQKETCKF